MATKRKSTAAATAAPPTKIRGTDVNTLTMPELTSIIDGMRAKAQIVPSERFIAGHQLECCTLKGTGSHGVHKHPQVDISRYVGKLHPLHGTKQLVHLIYWRFINHGALFEAGTDEELPLLHALHDETPAIGITSRRRTG